MNLLTIIGRLLFYQKPDEYQPFELLEDQDDEKDSNISSNSSEEKKAFSAKIAEFFSKKSEEKPPPQKIQADLLGKKLHDHLTKMKTEFNVPTNTDIVIREFLILQNIPAFIVYLEGIADQRTINNQILRPLMSALDIESKEPIRPVDYVSNNLLSTNQILRACLYSEAVAWILNGKTALFLDGCSETILIETTNFEKRAVSTPLKEIAIQGPQEAFIEDLRTNITLIRKILRNKRLITEIVPVAEENHLDCALMYIDDITNPQIVQEAKRRLNNINTDFVADGVLAQLIEDHPLAIFPQILGTERPDRAAALLMEGRIAILMDGTPTVNIVPITFFHFFHTSEDFFLRWQYGTFLRLVRLLAGTLAIFLPGLYLALTLYHHETIPLGLLTSIIATRTNLPFPAIAELLVMDTSWELIREAGTRVPGVIGQTLGIIGGVILGQAAVAAGLVSPILIIIVAITGLGNFSIPSFSMGFAIRILRFVFLFLGAFAGFYGIALGIIVFGGLACSMRSFGAPYFAPVAPKTLGPSIILRTPSCLEKDRPDILNPQKRKKTKRAVRGWVQQDGEDNHD